MDGNCTSDFEVRPGPRLVVGPGSIDRLGRLSRELAGSRALVVSDPGIVEAGHTAGAIESLTEAGVATAVFDAFGENPTADDVEAGAALAREFRPDLLVGLGGGSSMDCAKGINFLLSCGGQMRDYKGRGTATGPMLPAIAVPTTAGTGSEVTVAAVISDPERQTKLVIVDPRMVPKMAALDPSLMTGLPPHITAATGIDALTHAIESFVGNWATPYTEGMSLSAVGLIFENLRTACHDGKNLEAREKMLLASTYAGIAFTRANVGYVHAIAHQFGGRYHTPHGLANAIVLPHVLKFSAPDIIDRLAQLAVRAKVGSEGEPEDELAEKFIAAVEQLNRDVGIPLYLDALQEADIPALAKAACHEAHTGYPVPRYMDQAGCEALIRQVLPPRPAAVASSTVKARKTRTARPKHRNNTTETQQ